MPVRASATRTQNKIARLTALAEHPNTPAPEAALARHALSRLLANIAEAGGKTPAHIDRRWYGAKYDHTNKLTTVDIAKLIREEIKLLRKIAKSAGAIADETALKAVDPIGDMPAQIKISVRSQYYSGGSSIDITVKNVPLRWGFVPAAQPTEYRRYDRSPALNALTMALRSAMSAYNHDGSDILSDYWDVRFMGFVEVEHPEDAR